MEPLPELENIPIFETPKKTQLKQLNGKENVLRETNMNIQNSTSKSPPLKPAKKFRTEDNEILRVKRKISNATKMGLPVQTRNPATMAKRNARERRRVQNINCTLDNLERILPEHYVDKKDKNKKLSKLEILRCTIDYIKSLQGILTEDNQNNNLLLDAAAGLLPSFMFQNNSQMMDISSLGHMAQQSAEMMDLGGQMGFPPTTCHSDDNQWILVPQQTISTTLPQQTSLVQQIPPLYTQQQYDQAFWNVL